MSDDNILGTSEGTSREREGQRSAISQRTQQRLEDHQEILDGYAEEVERNYSTIENLTATIGFLRKQLRMTANAKGRSG